MGFRKVFRSVARVFSTKDKKVGNQVNTTKSKRLTKSQYPRNTTKSTKNRVKNLVNFLTRSRSRRHSTESAPESETLVDSSSPSSPDNNTVETIEQVSEDASSENTTSYYIDDRLTGPSLAQTALPILVVIDGGIQSIEDVEVTDIAVLPLAPIASVIESVLDGNLNDDGDQLAEAAEATGPVISVNNDAVDSQGKPHKVYTPYEKTNTDVQFPNADLTVEILVNEADATEYAVPNPNDISAEDNSLPLVSTELSVNIPEDYQLVVTPLATPNEDGVVQVVVATVDDEIQLSEEPTGDNDASTIRDEDTEDVFHQRRNSAPGNLVSPNSHYPNGRCASLTPSDAENEAMFNDPNNYIVHDESDMYVEPQLNLHHSFLAEPTVPMVTTPIDVPARKTSLPNSASEVVFSHNTVETLEVVSESQSLNEPDSVEQEVFMLELGKRMSVELANREAYLSELRNTFPVKQDSSDLVDEKAMEVIVPQRVKQPWETNAEEIVRTYRIPSYSQFRSVFHPPGLTVPWGPHNPIPTRIDDFRGSDPWLPNPWTNPDEYHQLNRIQKRWVQLEVLYQTRLYWLGVTSKAIVHLERNPGDKLYVFNNFCGWYGCQAEKCKHSRVDGRLYFFDLHSYYPTWKKLRDEQLLLDNEQFISNAAHEPSNDANALEQTALRDQEAAQDVESRPPQLPNAHFGLAMIKMPIEPKQSRWTGLFKAQQESGCAKAEVSQDVVPNASENIAPVSNFGLAMADFPVQPKKSRCAKFFIAQPTSEQGTQDSVAEETPRDPAPQAHFGLQTVKISVSPKKSRFAALFKAQALAKQGIAPAPTSDSEDSNETFDSLNGSKSDGLSTRDTSIEPPQKPNFNPEESTLSDIYGSNEAGEGDLYSASPLRGPSPAPTAPVQLSSVQAPENFMGGSLASRHQGSWQLYDDQGFLIDDNVKSTGEYIIGDTMEGPGDDLALVLGQVGFPIESPHEESREMMDGEPWVLIRVEYASGDFEFEEVPEGAELLESFYEDGWPVSEREVHCVTQSIREGLEEENLAVIEIVSDFDFYANAPDSGWEAPEDSYVSPIRGRLQAPKELNAKAYAQGQASCDQATKDGSDATESHLEDPDDDGDDIESETGSRELDKNDDTLDTKAPGSNEKDIVPKSTAQESDKSVEDAEPIYQFSRIPIQARPTVSGLALAVQELTGQEIGQTNLLGFNDSLDTFMNSEPLPILQKDANTVHSSNMFRQIDFARDELINRWMNGEDQYDPDGPTCRFVLQEGGVCERMPQELALRIKDTENMLWASGATFAKLALADKSQVPKKMTTETGFYLPGQVNNLWKPEFVAECVKDLDVTGASLFLGENDLSAFDGNKSTF
ncbi:hypothetical protein BOTCAL_0352g00130 [Botryotinia calthae]|uniref:Uncharacterized protein n=1 Tax=Botryotinia calthae TaxID=38488 RepID=A0A4Y8CTC5_9HELO|nr:hypothetical protein BOTCAL_0352g00130 [Botryotinia calthae]